MFNDDEPIKYTDLPRLKKLTLGKDSVWLFESKMIKARNVKNFIFKESLRMESDESWLLMNYLRDQKQLEELEMSRKAIWNFLLSSAKDEFSFKLRKVTINLYKEDYASPNHVSGHPNSIFISFYLPAFLEKHKDSLRHLVWNGGVIKEISVLKILTSRLTKLELYFRHISCYELDDEIFEIENETIQSLVLGRSNESNAGSYLEHENDVLAFIIKKCRRLQCFEIIDSTLDSILFESLRNLELLTELKLVNCELQGDRLELPYLEKIEVQNSGGSEATEKLTEFISVNPQLKAIRVPRDFRGNAALEKYSSIIEFIKIPFLEDDYDESFTLQTIENLWIEK